MSLYCTCLKKATYSSSIFRDQVPKSLVIFGKKGLTTIHILFKKLGHFMIVKRIITQANRQFCQINRIHLRPHPVILTDERLFMAIINEDTLK